MLQTLHFNQRLDTNNLSARESRLVHLNAPGGAPTAPAPMPGGKWQALKSGALKAGKFIGKPAYYLSGAFIPWNIYKGTRTGARGVKHATGFVARTGYEAAAGVPGGIAKASYLMGIKGPIDCVKMNLVDVPLAVYEWALKTPGNLLRTIPNIITGTREALFDVFPSKVKDAWNSAWSLKLRDTVRSTRQAITSTIAHPFKKVLAPHLEGPAKVVNKWASSYLQFIPKYRQGISEILNGFSRTAMAPVTAYGQTKAAMAA